MTKVEVELRFWGDDPPIAELSGSGFGTNWSRRDPVPGSPVMRRKEGGWSIASSATAGAGLEEHIADIFERVMSFWPQLTGAAASADVELSIALYVSSGPQPVLRVPRTHLSRLAELGAEIDVDVFDWIPEGG